MLRRGGHEPLVPDRSGILRSDVFPGLGLDVPALLRGDAAGLQAAVSAGIGTPEHEALVRRLTS